MNCWRPRTFISKLLVLGVLCFHGCKINYSFTGASISPDIKTLSVQYFPNNSQLNNPQLSQMFTETLKDFFLRQTSLLLTQNEGDLQISGEIVNYNITPDAVQSNELASQNRLTMTIKVNFVNTKDEKQNFETTFSRFTTYDNSQNLSDIEETLIEQLNTQLVQDVFNKSVGNW